MGEAEEGPNTRKASVHLDNKQGEPRDFRFVGPFVLHSDLLHICILHFRDLAVDGVTFLRNN